MSKQFHNINRLMRKPRQAMSRQHRQTIENFKLIAAQIELKKASLEEEDESTTESD